jgi:hypothetical protein
LFSSLVLSIYSFLVDTTSDIVADSPCHTFLG